MSIFCPHRAGYDSRSTTVFMTHAKVVTRRNFSPGRSVMTMGVGAGTPLQNARTIAPIIDGKTCLGDWRRRDWPADRPWPCRTSSTRVHSGGTCAILQPTGLSDSPPTFRRSLRNGRCVGLCHCLSGSIAQAHAGRCGAADMGVRRWLHLSRVRNGARSSRVFP